MADKLLIYGAAGHSGRLLARAAAARWAAGGPYELLLGARRADALAPLARELGLPTRVFDLRDAAAVARTLAEPGLAVLVNAAGPFADTAPVLAPAAVRAGLHYVDLNGEADVYRRLDDLGYVAAQAGVTLVCGAGHSAATSDLLLEHALGRITDAGVAEVGMVRIAFDAVPQLSAGSLRSAWRQVREQVVVMRGGPGANALRMVHEPVGRLERWADFGRGPCIVSAANLLDLYTARLTLQRRLDPDQGAALLSRVRGVEAYVATPDTLRAGLQWAALAAPLVALPGVRRTLALQAAVLADAGRVQTAQGHRVLLQIEDAFGDLLIDWRADTPDPYAFSARTLLGVVDGLRRAPQPGWRTPAELFDVPASFADPSQGLWQGCTLQLRSRLPEPAR